MTPRTSEMLQKEIVEYLKKQPKNEGWVDLNVETMTDVIPWGKCAIRIAIRELVGKNILKVEPVVYSIRRKVKFVND